MQQSVFVDDVDNMYVVVQKKTSLKLAYGTENNRWKNYPKRWQLCQKIQKEVSRFCYSISNSHVEFECYNNVKSEDKIKSILVTDNFKEIKDV